MTLFYVDVDCSISPF